MSKLLLSIDLSSTCTGWSIFDMSNHKPIAFGIIKGKNFKDTSNLRITMRRLVQMAEELLLIIKTYSPSHIVIEEIAGSKNRIGQKTLDMMHGILMYHIMPLLDSVTYYDVSGIQGWRTDLGLKLTQADKINNKESKALNKKLGRGSTKMPIITPKHLACRYVNSQFGMNLNVDLTKSDADICDSLAMGHAFLRFRCTKLEK
jgi:Holliday junction resolvasome RuvABC endonuclease subunit